MLGVEAVEEGSPGLWGGGANAGLGEGFWDEGPDAEYTGVRWRGGMAGLGKPYVKDRDVAVDELLQYPHLMLPSPIRLEHTRCKQEGQVSCAHLV